MVPVKPNRKSIYDTLALKRRERDSGETRRRFVAERESHAFCDGGMMRQALLRVGRVCVRNVQVISWLTEEFVVCFSHIALQFHMLWISTVHNERTRYG